LPTGSMTASRWTGSHGPPSCPWSLLLPPLAGPEVSGEGPALPTGSMTASRRTGSRGPPSCPWSLLLPPLAGPAVSGREAGLANLINDRFQRDREICLALLLLSPCPLDRMKWLRPVSYCPVMFSEEKCKPYLVSLLYSHTVFPKLIRGGNYFCPFWSHFAQDRMISWFKNTQHIYFF
jgi:hypothetical protein